VLRRIFGPKREEVTGGTLKMEAKHSSEMLVNIYKTTLNIFTAVRTSDFRK
jgi:hypothetical protein